MISKKNSDTAISPSTMLFVRDGFSTSTWSDSCGLRVGSAANAGGTLLGTSISRAAPAKGPDVPKAHALRPTTIGIRPSPPKIAGRPQKRQNVSISASVGFRGSYSTGTFAPVSNSAGSDPPAEMIFNEIHVRNVLDDDALSPDGVSFQVNCPLGERSSGAERDDSSHNEDHSEEPRVLHAEFTLHKFPFFHPSNPSLRSPTSPDNDWRCVTRSYSSRFPTKDYARKPSLVHRVPENTSKTSFR